jgi:ABC-type sugar transport system substrate-binding protein
MSRRPFGSLLGAAACTIVLAACGTAGSGSAGSPTGARVVYSGAVTDDAYAAIACGVKGRAEELGVTVDVQSPPEFTAPAQTQTINAAIAGNPDGLIVSPADANAMAAPLAGAKARDVPVVTALNTLADPTPLSSQVLADEAAGGIRSAQLVADRLAGKPGKVAVITFTPGRSTPADTRWHSFEQEIAEYPNITYLGPEIVATVDPQEATAKMNALLAREPDLTAVVATFGRAGDGAATALRQRGQTMLLVTYDTNAGVVAALRRGEISALIDYNLPEMGRRALDQVLAAHSGQPTNPTTKLPPMVFTQATIDDPATATALQSTPCPIP